MSCASALTSSAPNTTALTDCCSSDPNCCAAAIASIELLFAVPPLCSMKTSMPLLIRVLLCKSVARKLSPQCEVFGPDRLRPLSHRRYRAVASASSSAAGKLSRYVDAKDARRHPQKESLL